MTSLRFSAALSTRHDSSVAVREAAELLAAGLDGGKPDLLLAFAAQQHAGEFDSLASRLGDLTGARILLGCGAEGVIGGQREVEREPALALWAVRGEDRGRAPFRLEAHAGEEGPVFSGEPDLLSSAPRGSSLILLGDPYSFPMAAYLESLEERAPGLPAVGGMASGGQGAGANSLFFGDQHLTAGAVGLVVAGGVRLQPTISQAYRPIGEPLVITACEGSQIRKLGGKPAAPTMMHVLEGVSEEDRQLLQQGPFLGVAWDAAKSEFERTDFLAHPIRGIAPQEQAIVIVGHVRRGQTVQFMVRDPHTAGDDLVQRLERMDGPPEEPHRAGALLFSCNGRGKRMFGEKDHDISRVHHRLGAEVPAAGFFAMGEIGPVFGRNQLHGFAASVAVYRAAASG